MIVKLLEVRDRMTFIPVMAIKTHCDDKRKGFLLKRGGYNSEDFVILMKLSESSLATCESYDWKDRTMKTAHDFIIENFLELDDGDVIDVEFILGETKTIKISERFGN